MSNIVSSTKTIPSWLPSAISIIVTIIAVVVLDNSFNWQLNNISSYRFFPVLGLIAFSVMWTHYIAGFVYTLAHQSQDSIEPWYRYSGYVVLIAILFHPGILLYQRFR